MSRGSPAYVGVLIMREVTMEKTLDEKAERKRHRAKAKKELPIVIEVIDHAQGTITVLCHSAFLPKKGEVGYYTINDHQTLQIT